MLPLDIIKRQLIFAEDLEERLESGKRGVCCLASPGRLRPQGRRTPVCWGVGAEQGPQPRPHALGLGTSSLSEVPEGARGHPCM